MIAQRERVAALGGTRQDKIIIIDPENWLQVLKDMSQRVLAKQ